MATAEVDLRLVADEDQLQRFEKLLAAGHIAPRGERGAAIGILNRSDDDVIAAMTHPR